MNKDTAIRYLVDAQGRPQGVVLDEKFWGHVCRDVLATLHRLFPKEEPLPEPLADYALLEKYWDFRYDLGTQVSCEVCNATTPDWREDDPRKFRLCAANMGGLLVFECANCQARITRRHFKDKVTESCTPHITCACG